jgi:DNA-binding response OmpR family regulator
MATARKIVLIEDDREIQSTLLGVLESAGYDVVAASNGIEGQKLVKSHDPDLVITDMMMPRMGGFPVLEFLRTLESPPQVIMITANEGGRHKAYAEMLGVADYLRKPFAMDMMLETVERVLGEASPADQADATAPPKKAAAGASSRAPAATSTEDENGESKLRKRVRKKT